jgi:hypothetical protein
MTIDQLRSDLARRNLRGLHFILASIVLWTGILVVWYFPISENIYTRNLFTFICTAPLMPLAFLFSKLLKAEFSAKDNPLNNLGIVFSINQFLYILIAMWAYAAAPTNMVMIIAMIFGAHLLPFAWLYQSRAYLIMSILIPIITLIMGYNLPAERVFILAATMIALEAVFATWLAIENRKLAEPSAAAERKSA